MRVIDVHHQGREKVIACFEIDGVLVDPGPESSLATLLDALGDLAPKAVLLTHIHFDHAGASGALVRRFPDIPVYVHERGARHMADPERLVASATRLYGEEGMRRLWGEIVPVPEVNLRVLAGGESDVEGAFTVRYTPGHASHHVAYLHEPTRTAFVGDVAGVRIPPSDLVIAPTPPPDIDVDAWLRSLDLVQQWKPEALALTHFGVVDDVPHHLDCVRSALRDEAALARRMTCEQFVAAYEKRVAGPYAETYLQAAPAEHLWLGLHRWWTRGDA